MSAIMPQGEGIRKAVKWISAELDANPQKAPLKLVQDAVSRFDLSPKDAEFLVQFYKQGKRDLPSDA